MFIIVDLREAGLGGHFIEYERSVLRSMMGIILFSSKYFFDETGRILQIDPEAMQPGADTLYM